MIVTVVFCLLHMKYNENNKKKTASLPGHKFEINNRDFYSIKFWTNMFIIGFLRLFSIVLGLMALKQATISFVETVKSSSPLFTVVISGTFLGEVTGFWTKTSLLPIMLGLALCSSFELNFSLFGFTAAVLTNLTEW